LQTATWEIEKEYLRSLGELQGNGRQRARTFELAFPHVKMKTTSSWSTRQKKEPFKTRR